MDYLYNDEELHGLTGPHLQQKAQEIKQRFDLRRNYFHTLRNNITDVGQWAFLNNKIIEFDKNQFTPWNQTWNNVYRTNDVNQLKAFFNNGVNLYQSLEDSVSEIKPQYLSTDEVETLKQDVLKRIDEDMISIKNETLEVINKGIQDLLNLKSELGLQKNFADNLKVVRKNSNYTKYLYLIAFAFSLIFIASFLVFSYKLEFIQNLESYEKILIRIGAVTSLGILSYVLFQQFKLHQILHLKYTHLDNFLGGGATYINQLVSQDGELKKSTNKRLTEMFIEIEDTIGNAKQIIHPSDSYTKAIQETLEHLTNKVGDLSKAVKEFKNPSV